MGAIYSVKTGCLHCLCRHRHFGLAAADAGRRQGDGFSPVPEIAGQIRGLSLSELSENLQSPECWRRLNSGALKSDHHTKQAMLNMNLNARGPVGGELSVRQKSQSNR